MLTKLSSLYRIVVVCALSLAGTWVGNGAVSDAGEEGKLVLVEDGVSRAPIVIFENAPPLTRRAADELAYYIEKTSGARPDVLEGRPDPLPESAIWVGCQPVLEELFPDQDFDFKHPEEILIAANSEHLVIAGRDRWDPDHLTVDFGRRTIEGVQQEYGTHNAVYTFLQDYLDVRWLWPGELGEDILRQNTIMFDSFEFRYHPQVRARSGLLSWAQMDRGVLGPEHPGTFAGGASSNYWARAQRLQLCELPSLGGHGFPGGLGAGFHWWDRFHETNPEYFALQPDGSRGGGEKPYPGRRTVKMCHSNPDLARQWLDDVAARLEENPNQRVFNAAPGDSSVTGHCVCENCRAWDHPDGEHVRLTWQGLSQIYVALSDRDVTFANRVARGLKERFPDRELYVYTLSYGPSAPAPLAVVPEDNVIIGNVSNFLLRSDIIHPRFTATFKQMFADWGEVTTMNFWRPNVGSPVGWQWGMPDVPFTRTIKDMKFAAENNWMGIYVDYVREHWATQGPLYYLMAYLTWDPHQDAQAILQDYYRRAFGPAAKEMEAYWGYMEKIREECYGTEQPGYADHDVLDYYNDERLGQAVALLNAAREALSADDDLYRERIEFVQTGLGFTRLVTECGRLVREYNRTGASDDVRARARAQIHENWEKLRALQQKHPGAMRWNLFFEGAGARGGPAPTRHAPPLWIP